MWGLAWAALSRRLEQRRLARHAIPDELWELTLARHPFVGARSLADRERLRRLSSLFLASKEFHGAHGFEVSDRIALAVTVQACLPILELGLQVYDGFVGIVLHPEEVMARRELIDEDGVVHEYNEALVGEAMAGGPVMLSWPDVDASGVWQDEAYNVVIHEFAHVIDMADGRADGIPPLDSLQARGEWQAVMQEEYEAFCDEVEQGIETVIDPYGAEAEEEFFAVACEAFFVSPQRMSEEWPRLYRLLGSYFQQDPAASLRASA